MLSKHTSTAAKSSPFYPQAPGVHALANECKAAIFHADLFRAGRADACNLIKRIYLGGLAKHLTMLATSCPGLDVSGHTARSCSVLQTSDYIIFNFVFTSFWVWELFLSLFWDCPGLGRIFLLSCCSYFLLLFLHSMCMVGLKPPSWGIG